MTCNVKIECCIGRDSNTCFKNDPTESSGKTKVIIGIILVLCLITGLGIYFGIYYNNDFESQGIYTVYFNCQKNKYRLKLT